MPLVRRTADELVRRLREDVERGRRFAFFLGAGCSVSSQIPAAGKLVLENWLPRLHKICAPADSDMISWAEREIPGFDVAAPGASYGTVMDRLLPRREQRQQEIEDLCRGKYPSYAYQILAKIASMKGGVFNVILTTNFDDLVETALFLYSDAPRRVIKHERLADFIRPRRIDLHLVKLHGDHSLAPYNTAEETAVINEHLHERVCDLLDDHGIIFIGYNGSDEGIASMLESLPTDHLSWGTCWVNEEEPNGLLRGWLDAQNADWVKVRFEDFMTLLRDIFKLGPLEPSSIGRAFYDQVSVSLVSSSTPVPTTNNESIAKKEDENLSTPSRAEHDILARAAGRKLHVRDVVSVALTASRVPPTAGIVAEVAERWLEYTLLATAYSEDMKLGMLDLDILARPATEQTTIDRLFEQAVHNNTTYTDAQLEEAWKTQGPGEEMRARHILLKVPSNATLPQRDDVRRAAEVIQREAAAPGADFSALARRYSEDLSKESGGDLGFFGRGIMVPQFEDAVLKLELGQVSPVIESPFGYHVIKLEERRIRPLGDERELFCQYLIQRARQIDIQDFVDSLRTAADLTVDDGAAAQVKEMAQAGSHSLTAGVVKWTLATFDGGQLTAADLRYEMNASPTAALTELALASISAVNEVIKGQATKRLLLAEARKRGIQLTPEELREAREQVLATIQQLVETAGIEPVRTLNAMGDQPTIERLVLENLKEAVLRQRQMPALGPIGSQLRNIYDAKINVEIIPRVVDTIKRIRASQVLTMDHEVWYVPRD